MKTCKICNGKFDDSFDFCINDGGPLEVEFNISPGMIFDGQYQIEDILGKGGMGVVYKARHKLLNDLVAIKIILPNLANQQFKQRFLREGQVARRVKHPNIVMVLEMRITSDDIIYMVMEHINGHTLTTEIEKRKQKRFSPTEALEILTPIATALQVAHTLGVVHRDLKPGNIMIGKDFIGQRVIKLLDLGLAKLRPTENKTDEKLTKLTMVGEIIGTPLYMPPEQWHGSDNGEPEIDGRTDIYSLGIVFYELVGGKRPFHGMSLEHLAYQHMAVVPPSLKEMDPTIPSGFSDAIAQAMAKNIKDRPATMDEFIGKLKQSLAPAFVEPMLPKDIKMNEARYIIKHLTGSKAGQTEEVPFQNNSELTFGRDPVSIIKYDVYKDDIVARQQAKLCRDTQDISVFALTDLNSRNGTFINGQRITGTNRLSPGDKVQFGSNGPEFVFDFYQPLVPLTRIPESEVATRIGTQIPPPKKKETVIVRHLSGSKTGQIEKFAIKDLNEITIGRAFTSTIKYDPEQDMIVSTNHARIGWKQDTNQQFFIVDLNSRNGTFVDDQRITVPTTIGSGAVIQLGYNGPKFQFNLQ